jgi:hypothetical protein
MVNRDVKKSLDCWIMNINKDHMVPSISSKFATTRALIASRPFDIRSWREYGKHGITTLTIRALASRKASKNGSVSMM